MAPRPGRLLILARVLCAAPVRPGSSCGRRDTAPLSTVAPARRRGYCPQAVTSPPAPSAAGRRPVAPNAAGHAGRAL